MSREPSFHEQRIAALGLEHRAVEPPSFGLANSAAEYLGTPAMEREIEHSKAISLKRIADALWGDNDTTGIVQLIGGFEARR